MWTTTRQARKHKTHSTPQTAVSNSLGHHKAVELKYQIWTLDHCCCSCNNAKATPAWNLRDVHKLAGASRARLINAIRVSALCTTALLAVPRAVRARLDLQYHYCCESSVWLGPVFSARPHANNKNARKKTSSPNQPGIRAHPPRRS